MRTIFSVKYNNPDYPDEDWAADWGWSERGRWNMSRSPSQKIDWEIVNNEIDRRAYRAILEKFGLIEWQQKYSLLYILRSSPAKLAKERREKEYKLPRLEIISDNLCVEAGKGHIPRHAEEYD